MKKNAEKRSFSFNLVTYISREEIEQYCSRENVNNYAYIYHDCDTYGQDIFDGDTLIHRANDIKEPHFHIVITFRNARTWSAVCKDFAKYEQNTRVEYVADLESCLRYLTHEYEDGKHVYNRSLVRATYGYFRGDFSSLEDNKAVQIIQDLEKGVAPIDMVRRYGREYVVNRKAYQSMWNICYDRPADDYERTLINRIADLEELLAERERYISELQFTIKQHENSLKRTRKAVMTIGKEKMHTFERVADHVASPFDD